MSVVDLTKIEKNMISKPVFKVIDIDDIKPNIKNSKKRVLRNIDELCLNIKQCGLLKPLEVYEKDGEYILIGGERRYTALRKLVDEDDYNPEINCLVYKYSSQEEEELLIILSNAQEKKTDEEKVEDVKRLLNILERKPELKEKGEPTVVWLAGFLGCSPRTAQKFKNMAEGKVVNDKKEKQKDTELKETNYKEKLQKFFSQTMKKANKLYEEIPEELFEQIIRDEKGKEMSVKEMLLRFIKLSEGCKILIEKVEE